MSLTQAYLNQLFDGQSYGARNGLVPRDWQWELLDTYMSSVQAWIDAPAGNGGGGQHRFTIFAGTGCGKTKAVALLLCYLLNRDLIRQVFFVCPNTSILLKTADDFRDYFGIDLIPFHAEKLKHGVPRSLQGCLLTYGVFGKRSGLLKRISKERSAVVFDELHHLGEDELGNKTPWSDGAERAFGHVPFIIGSTGTPYRLRGDRVFAFKYEGSPVNGLYRLRPDFSYPLGRGIAEEYNREPLFIFHGEDEGTKVRIREGPEAPPREVTFADELSDYCSSLRLRGAVSYGSLPRKTLLKNALALIREEGRRCIIYLGGDGSGDDSPTMDATSRLPAELKELGYTEENDFEIITSNDKESHRKIRGFGKSRKWILISINMVSEGTDIPELSAAIFLTTVTAKMTTIQRIGRILRYMGKDDPSKDALIFMFADPAYLAIRNELKAEIKEEETRLKKMSAESGRGCVREEDARRYRAEAIGISGGAATSISFGDRDWPIDVFNAANDRRKKRGLSSSLLLTALSLIMEEADGDA